MKVLWYLSRPFYLLGLLAAVPAFIIAVNNFGKDVEVALPMLLGSIGYFVGGFVLLSWVPRQLKQVLDARVDAFKRNGFHADCEAYSVMLNRYVGFDRRAKQALLIDVDSGREELVAFATVADWNVEEERNRPMHLRLATRMPSLPEFGLRVDRRQAAHWEANLAAMFG